VRMIVPPLTHRKAIDRRLVVFFRSHRSAAFRRAVSDMCRYYSVKRPRIEWYEYIDWGKTAGKTLENGRILLVHPENWKRGRVYNSERMWVQMVYHEMAHYLFWTDAERKADAFTRRMVRGLRERASAIRSCSRRTAMSSRSAAGRGARRAASRIRRRKSSLSLRARSRRKRV
jgi:predicted SprT family Zn-dependent metalloprotease